MLLLPRHENAIAMTIPNIKQFSIHRILKSVNGSTYFGSTHILHIILAPLHENAVKAPTTQVIRQISFVSLLLSKSNESS